jgi:hypothetical protein
VLPLGLSVTYDNTATGNIYISGAPLNLGITNVELTVISPEGEDIIAFTIEVTPVVPVVAKKLIIGKRKCPPRKPAVKKESDPTPAPPKTSDPHVDIGTTILHAYRNLSPEQIGGMRRDTKELMGLQKELMGSLAEMKPAIEQGAELLKTFGTFFGKDGEQPVA